MHFLSPTRWLSAALLSVSLLACVAHAATFGVPVERILGPEVPTGKYKHPSSITELSNGDLLLAYYGGEGEYAKATSVFASRLPKGGKRWSAPTAIASNPVYSMGNPVLWQAPEGTVWLFFVVRPGATWSTSRIMAKTSPDGGRTWSDAFVVSWDAGTMVRGRPIVNRGGEYVLPVYLETGADTEFTAPDTSSFFLLFNPTNRVWTPSNKVASRMGNLQPAVVQVEGDHLLAFCRRGGDYSPGNDGYVVRTESRDGGRTWSAGEETDFPNPNAAVEMLRLDTGHLLFIYNDSMNDRTPLTAALSMDGGKTFPHRRQIASGDGDFAYPTAIQTRDRRIHVTFTTDGRTVIRRAVFSERTLLE